MGLENLHTDPLTLYAKDPEHYRLALRAAFGAI
jgi:hypothetical protein